jgi:hypothetical protein
VHLLTQTDYVANFVFCRHHLRKTERKSYRCERHLGNSSGATWTSVWPARLVLQQFRDIIEQFTREADWPIGCA